MKADYAYFMFWSSVDLEVPGVNNMGYNERYKKFWYEVCGKYFMERNQSLPNVWRVEDMLRDEGFSDISWM